MEKRKKLLIILITFYICTLLGSSSVKADTSDITGQWYGHWETESLQVGHLGGQFEIFILQGTEQYWAFLYIPELGLFDIPVPMMIVGDQIIIADFMFGMIEGESLVGLAYALDPFSPDPSNPEILEVEWQAQKQLENTYPCLPPGPECEELPPLYCNGSAEYCSELLPFLPVEGPGYLNSPVNGETWEDQYRSYIRRDLMMIIKYATAKVACKTAEWDYGNFAPLGLVDMSEEDGSTPGTSNGSPDHPPGTHEDGKDIDTAYYQLYAPDNLARSVGRYYDEYGYFDAGHLTGPPDRLDVWRTALYIAYLSEHPRIRAIGVDGQVGLVLEEALDELVSLGWISSDLRDSIPLAYEVEDTGLGWYYFHHHHIHISINPLYSDLLLNTELTPEKLSRKSKGKYITAYIELNFNVSDQIDEGSVALILDGKTILYAEPNLSVVSDYNENGIPDLTVKFDRQALLENTGNGEVEVSITGSVYDYYFFQGTDTIVVFQ